MKKFIYTLLLTVLAFQSTYAIKPNKEVNDTYDLTFQRLIEESEKLYSVDVFTKLTNRKPKFHEKIALKFIQKYQEREYRKLRKRIDKHQSKECDLMILKNGDEIEVKIIEVSSKNIKYKKCDYLDGPLYTKDKSEIFMLKYSNGTKEMIDSDANPVSNNTNEVAPNPYDNVNTTGGWIVGILAGVLLSFLGMLFALAFEKGPKRRAFWKGWLIGFLLLLLIVLAANG